MKRRIVAAMLAGVMALGMLAGCGGSGKSDSDGGSSDKKSSDANIAVFYYTYSDTYIASAVQHSMQNLTRWALNIRTMMETVTRQHRTNRLIQQSRQVLQH